MLSIELVEVVSSFNIGSVVEDSRAHVGGILHYVAGDEERFMDSLPEIIDRSDKPRL